MPSVSEIVRKSAIPKTLSVPVQQDGQETVKTISAFEQAKALREELLATKYLESSADELEAEMEARRARRQAEIAEARARELEAQRKLEELRSNGHTPSGPSPLFDLLGMQIASANEQAKALREELAKANEGRMSEIINSLRQEIQDLKQQTILQPTAPRTSEGQDELLSRIVSVKEAIDALKPLMTGTPEFMGVQGDLTQLMLLRRWNDEMTLRLEELKDRRDERAWERRFQEQKLQLEHQRNQGLIRTLNQYAPVISQAARQRLGLPLDEPEPSYSCPNQECGGKLVMSENQDRAWCTRCSQTYQVNQSD